jgi:hypothetical protein
VHKYWQAATLQQLIHAGSSQQENRRWAPFRNAANIARVQGPYLLRRIEIAAFSIERQRTISSDGKEQRGRLTRSVKLVNFHNRKRKVVGNAP